MGVERGHKKRGTCVNLNSRNCSNHRTSVLPPAHYFGKGGPGPFSTNGTNSHRSHLKPGHPRVSCKDGNYKTGRSSRNSIKDRQQHRGPFHGPRMKTIGPRSRKWQTPLINMSSTAARRNRCSHNSQRNNLLSKRFPPNRSSFHCSYSGGRNFRRLKSYSPYIIASVSSRRISGGHTKKPPQQSPNLIRPDGTRSFSGLSNNGNVHRSTRRLVNKPH